MSAETEKKWFKDLQNKHRKTWEDRGKSELASYLRSNGGKVTGMVWDVLEDLKIEPTRESVGEAIRRGLLKSKGPGAPRCYGEKSHQLLCEFSGVCKPGFNLSTMSKPLSEAFDKNKIVSSMLNDGSSKDEVILALVNHADAILDSIERLRKS